MKKKRPVLRARQHDHATCVTGVVDRARNYASAQGVKLTPLRELVLRELTSSHGALGAYDVIERLALKGRRIAPISVYRVLNTLVEAGVAHKLESRNAYFACYRGHAADGPPVFLVCDSCGVVAETETEGIARSIAGIASRTGFRLDRPVLELTGRCKQCAGDAGA